MKLEHLKKNGTFMRYALILLLGVFVGVGITLERAVQAERQVAKTTEQPLPIEELRTFTEVFAPNAPAGKTTTATPGRVTAPPAGGTTVVVPERKMEVMSCPPDCRK